MRKQCLPLINFGEELTGIRNEKLFADILNRSLEDLTSKWLGENVCENPDKDKLMSDFLHSLNFTKEVVGETTIWWAKFNDIYVYFMKNPDLEFYEEDESDKPHIVKYDGDLVFCAEYESGIKYLKDEGFTFEVKEESVESAEEKSEIINQAAKHFINIYSDELDAMTSDGIYEWWYYNWSNWVEETNEDIYNEVEKAVWAEINKIIKKDCFNVEDLYTKNLVATYNADPFAVETDEQLHQVLMDLGVGYPIYSKGDEEFADLAAKLDGNVDTYEYICDGGDVIVGVLK